MPHLTPDLLIVGLNSSGTAALRTASERGANVLGLDARPAPSSSGLAGCAYDTRVWGLYPDGTVVTTNPAGTRAFMPGAIIIATGAIDLPLPLPGWHLPGVMGALHANRSLQPGTEVVVLRGPHAGTGGRSPDLGAFSILREYRLSDGLPVEIRDTGPHAALAIGDNAVSADRVILDNGTQPENTLARMAGIPSSFRPLAGGDVIEPGAIYAAGGTLVSVVGDAAGIGRDTAAIIDEASETARVMTAALGGGDIPRSIYPARAPWPEGGLPLLPAQLTDHTLVCPDEGVTVGAVRDAIGRGAQTVNDVKRRTRAAMATCQGRDCLWTIRALLAEQGRDYREPMTARPPVAGITLGELASLTSA